jgi:hypothetical protein
MNKFSKSEDKKKNLNKSASQLNTKGDQESKKRIHSIIDGLYSLFDKTKLDPILETFKLYEMLKEFYMKRLFELMKVKFF